MKRSLIIIFLLPVYFSLSAQQVWYFGNGAGLDFSSGQVKSIYGGKIFTLEGCASVCDPKGHLLFYTDGITVWTKSHREMLNGQGLKGSRSTTQSALIVQQPDTKGKYFLFTLDEKAGKNGLCYSVIEAASGEGVVTNKNIKLLALSTEKLTAVQHSNGKDVWVISHQWSSNNFYVFPVTAQGLGKPVIAAIGLAHAETGAGENREAIGYLCASPNGKKLASAVCYRGKNNLELFDFDNSTGKISNAVTVTLNGSPYGLAFSSDNTKLYVSFLKGNSGIVQYDMNDRSITEIVVNSKENTIGGLQLAPDGKIYIARTDDYLDVIEEPNKNATACMYKHTAVDLSPASSNFGLPNVCFSGSSSMLALSSLSSASSSSLLPSFPITSSNYFDCSKIIERPFSNKSQLVMTDIAVCESEYILSGKNFGASFNWSTLETTQKIKVTKSGLYRVAISKQGCTVTDSIRIRFRKELAVFSYLPSFNPEAEFLNSEFYFDIDEVQGFQLQVFDTKKKRVVFETTNAKKKWNGKNKKGSFVQEGEYFWTVKYKPNCPKDSNPVIQEGTVMVKRNKKK